MHDAVDLDRPSWLASLPFVAVHAVALATPFLSPLEWRWAALAAGTYAVRMFAITAGYHRYFSHRAYRTSRAFQLLLAVVGASAAQKGPLWWAAHHRDHHRFSDRPQDVHSPLERGLWRSHVGWILSRRHDATKLERVKDLAAYPELRLADRFHLLAPAALAAGLFVAGDGPRSCGASSCPRWRSGTRPSRSTRSRTCSAPAVPHPRRLAQQRGPGPVDLSHGILRALAARSAWSAPCGRRRRRSCVSAAG